MTTTLAVNDSPRIYAACLASYNAGTLHGAWISADQEPDEIAADVATMLRASRFPNVEVSCLRCENGADWRKGTTWNLIDCPACNNSRKVPSAEEWAIHDYDNMPDLGENPSIDSVSKHGQALALADEPAAYLAYFDSVGDCENFEEAWSGEWNSEQAFAEELIEDLGMLHGAANELIAHYFDYEAWTRDLFMSDYFSTECPTGGVYVFRGDL